MRTAVVPTDYHTRAASNPQIVKAVNRLSDAGINCVPLGFHSVPVNEIFIDSAYQREPKRERCQKMAKNWNWVLCGTSILSSRAPHLFAAVDGGHRKTALEMHNPAAEMPAMLFRFDDIAEEAKAFALLNTSRRMASPFSRIKAMRSAGDPLAEFVLGTLIEGSGRTGCEKNSRPDQVGCAATLFRWAKEDRAALLRVWNLYEPMCTAENGIILGNVIAGLCYLEQMANRQNPPETICDPYAIKRWKNYGYIGLTNAVKGAIARWGHGGEKVHAWGLQFAFNRNLPDHRKMKLVTLE